MLISGLKSWDLAMCKDLNFISGSEKQDHLFAIGTLVMNLLFKLDCRHFMFANATISFKQIISSYPGPLMLVSILVSAQPFILS